jgi:anti-anti-sigma factor
VQLAGEGLTANLTYLSWGALLRLEGEAGIANLGPMESLLTQTLARRPRLTILDVSELSILSTLAMGLLVRFQGGLGRWGGRVVVVGTRPTVRASLEAAHLAGLFEFRATVTDALTAV